MSVELKIPEIGESITEVTIGEWLMGVGDWIDVDGPVVEIETDKVNSELPAPVAGKLTEIRAQPGDVVGVGAVIGLMEAAEAPAGGAAPAPAAPPPAARTALRTPGRPRAGRSARSGGSFRSWISRLKKCEEARVLPRLSGLAPGNGAFRRRPCRGI